MRTDQNYVETSDQGQEALDDQSGDLAAYNRMHYDENFQLAQASSNSSSDNSQPTTQARTSRVPYMIGDSPYSSTPLSGLAFEGVTISNMEHPIFGGNRFNLAENGVTLPEDRILFSYRHFNNAFGTNVLGESSFQDAERFDVGFEKTLFDSLCSVQLNVPLTRQFDTDLDIFSDPSSDNLPVTDRHGDLGNLAATFKLLMQNRRQFAWSLGCAVNIPTGDDARISQNFTDPDLILSQSPLVFSESPTNISFSGRFENQTVNLVPFAAWAIRPTSRFFHQGFLQIDTPLNTSDAEISVSGTITPDDSDEFDDTTFNVADSGKIDQQTLLRLNMAFGYWLTQGAPGDTLRGIAAIFECHYTSVLDNAHPFVVPVTTLESNDSFVSDVPINVVAGPTLNHFDQVNLTGGLTIDLGGLVITNGVIVPVTDSLNRSFDFEYNVHANVRF